MKKFTIFTLIFVIIFASILLGQLEKGNQAIPFTLKNFAGTNYTVNFSGYNYTLIYFWSTAMDQMKQDIIILQREFANIPKFQTIAVLVDSTEKADAQNFFNNNNIQFTNLIDNGTVASTYRRGRLLPAMFLIDNKSNIMLAEFGISNTFFPNVKSVTSNKPPIAKFRADKTTGTAPLIVKFINESTE